MIYENDAIDHRDREVMMVQSHWANRRATDTAASAASIFPHNLCIGHMKQ